MKNSKHKNLLQKRYEKSCLYHVISWTITNLKFILIPGSKSTQLEKKEKNDEKYKSRRRLINKFKSPLMITGMIIIFVIMSFAVFESWISPFTYEEAFTRNSYAFSPPSLEHPLGTTYSGQDILARIIYGTKPTLLIIISSNLIRFIIGVFFGLLAAYYGGWLDMILMRFFDVIMSFPLVIFSTLILILWKASILHIVIIFTIFGTSYYARIMHNAAMKVKDLPFIYSAEVMGVNKTRIMFRHILPNSIQPLLIAFTFNFGRLIVSLSVIEFLQYRSYTSHIIGWIEWGTDIANARNFILEAPWAILWPSIIILITVIGFYLIGDGLMGNLDPKMRKIVRSHK